MQFWIRLMAKIQATAWMNDLSWEERTSVRLTRERNRTPKEHP